MPRELSEVVRPTALASREDALRVVGELTCCGGPRNMRGLDLHQVEPGYPEGCVTLAAYLHSQGAMGPQIDVQSPDAPWLRSIRNPLASNDEEPALARVWRYESTQELCTIVDRLLDATSGVVCCSTGVLQSLEWSLNEICDNVLEHANAGSGFIMLQHHRGSDKLTASIADSGIGIYASLGPSLPSPTSEIETIRLSLKEGVTRDGQTNQGNGLWGLTRLVTANTGRLRISSGSSAVKISEEKVDSETPLAELAPSPPGTTVTFTIDGNRPIDVAASIGHVPVNVRAEAMLGDADRLHVRLADGYDLGTRDGARELWTRVWNNVVESQTTAELDFSDVSIVTSSFADEFVAQPLLRIGFAQYTRTFELSRMNPMVAAVIDQAVIQRIGSGLPQTGRPRKPPKHKLKREPRGGARVRMRFTEEEASRIDRASGEMQVVEYLHQAVREHVAWRIEGLDDR